MGIGNVYANHQHLHPSVPTSWNFINFISNLLISIHCAQRLILYGLPKRWAKGKQPLCALE